MAKESLKHRIGPYRLYAPVYDRVFAPSFSEGHRKMYQSLDLEEGDRILEVGVGTGISLAFCPDYVQVEGIDFSESMLRQARQKLDDGGIGSNVVLSKMDAHELEFDDETFDHSLVAHALSVVSKPSRVLSKAHRGLWYGSSRGGESQSELFEHHYLQGNVNYTGIIQTGISGKINVIICYG